MEKITNKNSWKCLNGTTLKIIAMVTMFLDHAGKTIFYTQDWMTWVGRLAFPIFAFQIAEGYNHTKDFKKYLKRMFLFALITEIPFNIMHGSLIYLLGQNVLFTFCISLVVIRIMDTNWKKHWLRGVIVGGAGLVLGYLLAFAFMTDYMGYGVLMVVSFWLFGKVKFGWILQVLAMIYINWEMIAGQCFVWDIGGRELWVPIQAIAVFSMIPILMYNGEKGPGGKKFQHAVYIFYPAHMLILGVLMIIFVH